MTLTNKQPTKHWQDAPADLLRPLAETARTGLITDVDGTISPIVDDPAAASVTPRSRELLTALQSQLTLVAAVSGRAAADVYQRVGVPGLVALGNHGLERWTGDQAEAVPQVAAFRPALEDALTDIRQLDIDGLFLEDKGVTLSVHYRRAADPQAVRARFGPEVAAIAARHGLAYFEGRMIFELRPPVDINKGTAFRQLVQDYQLAAAVFIGDDTTDVDAMRMARQLRDAGSCYCLAFGVVSDGTPDSVRDAADWLLDGIPDVEAFLAWLLTSRSASNT